MSRKKYIASLLFCLCLVFTVSQRAHAMVTTAGGETITWEFQGMPSGKYFSANNPCVYRADTNYWHCEYGVMDFTYFIPLGFVGSVSPSQGKYPTLALYYSGATEYPRNQIRQISHVGTTPILVEASFYVPASARMFTIFYNSNNFGNGTDVNIQIDIRTVNYDYEMAQKYGGQEINADTEYCDENGQPGKPSIWKFNNRKGAGPGKCARMGLPHYSINTASRSLVLSDTDFAYGGLGPQINLTRTYNSNAPAMNALAYFPGKPSPMFGNRWAFTYDETLLSTCFGIELRQGEGNTLLFSENNCTEGAITKPTPPSGVFDSLQNLRDDAKGFSYWLYENKASRYKYRFEIVADPHVWQLVSVTDANGRTVRITRNPADGTIQKITDAAGRSTTFTYDDRKFCLAMITPNGKTAHYTYDASGNLVTSTDLAGNVTTYAYDADNYLIAMTLGDKTTQFVYDTVPPEFDPLLKPKPIAKVVNALGHGLTFQGDGAKATKVTDSLGKVSTYKAQGTGKTESTLDALDNGGGLKVYTNDQLTKYESPAGWTQSFTYDATGNVLTLTKADADLTSTETTTFSYDQNNNLTGLSDASNPGAVWAYEYDSNSNLTKSVRPSGNSTTYGYTGGVLTSATDAQGSTSALTYDGYGNITAATNALGETYSNTYDIVGNLIAQTDPAGNGDSYEYDGNRRLTRVTHADGSFRTFTYDCCSLIATTDENGHTTTIDRNKLLLPTSITDPLGHVTSFDYDANNRLVKTTLPDNSSTTITTDALNRPSVITDAMGNSRTIGYEGDWNVSALTDERGNTINFNYVKGRPKQTIEPQSTNPTGPSSSVTSTWDKAGRLQDKINARGTGVSFAYAPDGQLSAKRSYPTGSALSTYQYDKVGKLTRMDDAWGTTTFTFDGARRNTSITYPGGKLLTFSYLPTGRISQIGYPSGGTASYTYDKRNRLAAMSFGGQRLTFSYDAVGNLLGEVRSNNTASSYGYDARNLVTAIAHTRNGAAISQATYTRNGIGSVTQEQGFQPLMPASVAPTANATYNHANQIVTWNGDSYTYDLDGNLVAVVGRRNLSATYDAQNRLVSLRRDGQTSTYTYDGKGRRVKTENANGIVQNHYDNRGRLLFQTDGLGQVIATYFYADERLVAMSSAAGAYHFYHFDKTGNTLALTDAAGNIAASYGYLPYGEISRAYAGAAIANPFTYVGAMGVIDDGDGLYHMRTRSYDAVTGRFLQKDSIGVRGGLNLYEYTGGNPANFVDPKGTIGPIWMAVAAAVTVYGYYKTASTVDDMLRTGAVERENTQRIVDRMSKQGFEEQWTGTYTRERSRFAHLRTRGRLCHDALSLNMDFTVGVMTGFAGGAAGAEAAENIEKLVVTSEVALEVGEELIGPADLPDPENDPEMNP